ncbi:MAG: SDR family NAD(P)-dependent oxidoreductase, partial [Candidatus Binatia bacterium]
MELKGQTAVVTGAASGMGAATAEHFAALGAKVALLDVQEYAIAERAERIGGLAVACDVSDAASGEAAFARVRERFGGQLRYAISGSAALSREVAEFIDALGV